MTLPAVAPKPQGTVQLFHIAGIHVYLHWSWFLLLLWGMSERRDVYPQPFWNLAEFLALFAIVLLHEFGHALACRQVGGQAEQIVLWPLGGVAYVAPPQRPGAMLWSIAAGPLVNVLLVPILFMVAGLLAITGVLTAVPGLDQFISYLQLMNIVLLVFNILPVYPLDGGQILRSLLWFRLGPLRSLFATAIVGYVGLAALAFLAFQQRSWWMGFLVVYLFSHCHAAFRYARNAMNAEQRR